MSGDPAMTALSGRGGSLEARRRLSAYASAVVAEYPGIPLPVLLTWSIAPLDAMAMWALLDAVDEETVALDVGTFVGVSAFILASHPLVDRVVSIDPNPLVTDEVNEKKDALGAWIDPDHLPANLRVHDVTRLALAQFPSEARKVELFQGYLAAGAGLGQARGDASRRFEFGNLDGDRTPVVAFIDALHTAEGVFGDLAALFSAKPMAIAALDDCRRYWGPYVQAGVSRFLDQHTDYTFDLLADMCPGLAASNLGLVYPKGGPASKVVRELALHFSRSVDAVTLLEREEHLTDQVSALSNELSGLQDMIRRTQEELEIAERRAADAEGDLRTATAELKQALDRERLAESELLEMRQSTSWRLTSALRRISDITGRQRSPRSALALKARDDHSGTATSDRTSIRHRTHEVPLGAR